MMIMMILMIIMMIPNLVNSTILFNSLKQLPNDREADNIPSY